MTKPEAQVRQVLLLQVRQFSGQVAHIIKVTFRYTLVVLSQTQTPPTGVGMKVEGQVRQKEALVHDPQFEGQF